MPTSTRGNGKKRGLINRVWHSGLATFNQVVPPLQRVYLSLLLDALDFASDFLLCISIWQLDEDLWAEFSPVGTVKALIWVPALGTVLALISTVLTVNVKLTKLRQLKRVEVVDQQQLIKSIKHRCSTVGLLQHRRSEAQKLGLSDALYRELLALRADCSGARASMISLIIEDAFFICLNVLVILISGAVGAIGAIGISTSIASALYKLRETKRYFALKREIHLKTAELEALLASNGYRRDSVVALEQEERLKMHAVCACDTLGRSDLERRQQLYAALRSAGDTVLAKLEESSTFYKPRKAMLGRIERCDAAIAELQAEVRRQSAALTREDDKLHPSVGAAARNFQDRAAQLGESIRSLATSMREEPDEWWREGLATPVSERDAVVEVERVNLGPGAAGTGEDGGRLGVDAVELLRKTLKEELRRQNKRMKRKKEKKGEGKSASEKNTELATLPFIAAARCGELLARAEADGTERAAFQALKKYGCAGSKRTKWCRLAWILARRYERFSHDVCKEDVLNESVTRKNVEAVLLSLSRLPANDLELNWGYDKHTDDDWRLGLPESVLELAKSVNRAQGGFDDSAW